MAARVRESAILAAPIGQVWGAIRPVDFSFWSNVTSCDSDAEGVRKVTFSDRTVQKYRVTEISDQEYSITFELIESVPAVEYMSASHSWRLRRVTSDNSTFIETETVYSKDASTNATEDSRYRKLDLFKELRAALSKGVGKKVSGSVAVSKSAASGEEKALPPHGLPGTQYERSFIAVKPDGVQRGLVGTIIARFEAKGFRLVAMKLVRPTKAFAAQHYADLKKKSFFPTLIDFFSSGPVCAMVWEGKGVIATGRQMLGATNPAESAPGTIRGDFAITLGRNVCHGSDSPKGAEAEISLWFRQDELLSWGPAQEGWIYGD